MDCCHCEKFKSHHRCQAIVEQGEGTSTCGVVIFAMCSSSFGNEDGFFRCSRHSSGDSFHCGGYVLKINLGMDSSLFCVDMLRKICRKLGFTSCKFHKAVCLETIIKAVIDDKVYDAINPASCSTAIDSMSLRCRLLNVVMSEAFVPHLQFLGAQKDISELDKGRAGQGRAFGKMFLLSLMTIPSLIILN